MNILEILAVAVVLGLTTLFWFMVCKKKDADDTGCLFFFLCVAWLSIVCYFIEFFTKPLW